ncbi:hypothetical protein PQB76_gp043 [Arthrobacter phage Cheesy]|uniref:Uncharacterized protein n=1 Tax=Arthrobacter phage Cheesy TaxID=2015816 RepID=A0A222ZIN4_9CAUD|nr:hypothetical protein PQB76_gp043 [Arthrobacter phage Cheesy]ASR84623.1 hypothetical protein SEA_CHEESY_43 [Arthrobacter phage Cheesy]
MTEVNRRLSPAEEQLQIEYRNKKRELLRKDLCKVLNAHSAENVSGTPDFILADFLISQLEAYNHAVGERANWRGESTELPALQNHTPEGL